MPGIIAPLAAWASVLAAALSALLLAVGAGLVSISFCAIICCAFCAAPG
jgi:hypothetical protein